MILKGLRNIFSHFSPKTRYRIYIVILTTAVIASAAVTMTALMPREWTDPPFWWPHSAPNVYLGMIFVILTVGYMIWPNIVLKFGCLPAAITAGILSVAVSLASFIRPDLNSIQPLPLLPFLHRTLGMFPVGYTALTLFFQGLDRLHHPELRRKKKNRMADPDRKKLLDRIPSDRKAARRVFALILALCWLPVILLCFPGNLTGDTHKSVRSFDEPEAAVNMPWFLNLLHGGAIRLGGLLDSANDGLFVVCILQTLLFLYVYADFLGLMAEHGVPKGLLLCVAALFAIWPVFSTYAFSTVKDAVFTLWLLYFSKCLTELLFLKKKDADPAAIIPDPVRIWIELGLSALLLSFSRNGAVWIALISLAWLFLRLREYRVRTVSIAASALILSLGVPAVFGLGSSQIRENLSLPLQQTARVLQQHKTQMTEEELAEYEAVMSFEDWAKYDPGISDPVKSAFAPQPDSAYLRNFFSLWAKECLRHPETSLEAGILMNYGYWTPLADRSDLKERLFLGTRRFKVKTFTKTIPSLTANDGEQLDLLVDWDNFLNRIPVLRLFSRIGIYSWGLIAAFIYCLCRKDRREYAMLLLPLMIVFIGCCLSPVNGHYRYGFPLIAGTPLLGTAALFLRPSSASGPQSSEASSSPVS